MRLKEEHDSWNANAVKRRDYRHDPHSSPEVISKGKKKKGRSELVVTLIEVVTGKEWKKRVFVEGIPRKRIDHKHKWELAPRSTEWAEEYYEGDPPPPFYILYRCTHLNCKAVKHKKNHRYGYEYNKYRRRKKREEEAKLASQII